MELKSSSPRRIVGSDKWEVHTFIWGGAGNYRRHQKGDGLIWGFEE